VLTGWGGLFVYIILGIVWNVFHQVTGLAVKIFTNVVNGACINVASAILQFFYGFRSNDFILA